MRSAWAMLVPKRSLWIMTATSERTSSTPVRSARLRSGLGTGYSGSHFVVHQAQFAAQRAGLMLAFLGHLENGGVEALSGLDADDEQVESVGGARA